MPVRLSAAELYKIQQDDLLTAIADLRERNLPPTFSQSTRFDLLVEDNVRLPPKAVMALAALRPLGRVPFSSEFSGGESSAMFRLLLERGFELVTKITKVAGFDASFSVGRNRETQFVLIESRGPARNTDYGEGLEALLRGLADLDASIEDIVIDTGETRELSIEQRRLRLRSEDYPLRLRAVSDLGALRREVTGTAAATGRSPDATGSGNSTRRLRIVFTEPGDLELFTIVTFLAQNRGGPVTGRKGFTFRARPPASGGGQSGTRGAVEETDVTHIHEQMQQALYDSLVAIHGRDNVSCEDATSSGRPADIMVSLPEGYELFEIKTALAPRDCVREALGQLLEYAYWPGSPRFCWLWVIGPSPLDRETEEHLNGLRARFGIPLAYRQQAVETRSL